ncbi:MAG: GNAT family N-acetyltransferase [Candidatus Hodarchaeota archaeon]
MQETKESFKQKRIRTFFLSFESSSKRSESIEKIQEEIEDIGLIYIQMRLPVEKITPEYEAEVNKKVEHNILRAKIREATEEDLENIMNLYNKAWLTSNTPFSRITVNSLAEISKYPDTVILIAKVYGIDGGFIILDYEGPNNEYGVIAGLGILPRFQRKGLGTVLGLASWKYFKEKGIKELRCEVYIENKASYNFIKSLGFEEYGKKCYRNNDFIDEEQSL